MLLAVSCCAVPQIQYHASSSDGSYRFNYEIGDEGGRQSREETRNAEGVVLGKFSYQDPSGNLRLVEYRADSNGYSAKGHVGPEGAPKAELPLYALPELKTDSKTEAEATTEKPAEEPNQSTPPSPEKLEADESPANDEEKQEKDSGFFLLGLGGKRRLEKPSDTGKLNVQQEEKKSILYQPPFVYYPVIRMPYITDVKQLSRPVYIPSLHHHVPFLPYIPEIRHPVAPAKSYFHSYRITHP